MQNSVVTLTDGLSLGQLAKQAQLLANSDNTELINFEDDDNSELVTLQNNLISAGYDYAKSKTFGELELIHDRNEVLASDADSSNMCKYLLSNSKKLETQLSTAVGNVKCNFDSNVVGTSRIRQIHMPNFLPRNFASEIIYFITSDATSAKIDAADIDSYTQKQAMAFLQNKINSGVSPAIQAQPVESLQYITEVIRCYLYSTIQSLREYKHATLLQKRSTDYLVTDCLKGTKALLIARDDQMLQYAKKFIQCDGEFFVECPVCGKRINITRNSPVVCEVLSVDNNYNVLLTPQDIACDCGVHIALSTADYDIIWAGLSKQLHTTLKSLGGTSRYGKQTVSVFARYIPPVKDVLNLISYLVVDEFNNETNTDSLEAEGTWIIDSANLLLEDNFVEGTTSAAEEDTKEPDTKEPAEDLVDMNDYLLSIKRFHSKLKKFTIPSVDYNNCACQSIIEYSAREKEESLAKEEHKLSLASIAAYMCNVLSVDYKQYKDQALYYLINDIRYNQLLYNLLSETDIVNLQELIWTIKAYENCDVKLLSTTVIEQVASAVFQGSLDRSITLSDGTVIPESTKPEYLQALMLLANVKALPYYENLVREKKAAQLNAWKEIQTYSQQVGYIKLGKKTNVSMFDLYSIISSEEVANIVNDITDNIIVNNLLEGFFDFWASCGEEQYRSSVYKSAKNGDAEALRKPVADMLKSASPITAKLCEQNFESLRQKYYMASSTDLSNITSAMRRFDFYSFCNGILQTPNTVASVFGGAFTSVIGNAIYKIRLMAEKALDSVLGPSALRSDDLNYFKYYLHEFTEEEIKDVIANADVDLTLYSFTRFVPYRKDGETLIDYLHRYNELDYAEELSSINSHDYLENFKEFEQYIPLISYWVSITNMRYTNLLNAITCRRIIDASLQMPIKYAINFLGMSEDSLTYNNRVRYKPEIYKNHNALLHLIYHQFSEKLYDVMVAQRESFENITISDTSDAEDIDKMFNSNTVISIALGTITEDEEYADANSELGGVVDRANNLS